MAKQQANEFLKAVQSLTFNPVVIKQVDGEGLKLAFDSALLDDESRALYVCSIDAKQPIFDVAQVKPADAEAKLRFAVTLKDGAQGEPSELFQMVFPLSLPPFNSPGIDDVGIAALRSKLKAGMLPAIASALGLAPAAAPVAVLASGVAPSPVATPATPLKPGSWAFWRHYLPRGAGVLVLCAGVAYGMTGFFGKDKEPDPFAGIDPEIRKQMEAAGLRGANNPAAVNVTEQTLKAMGLDPGKAANLGCLAPDAK